MKWQEYFCNPASFPWYSTTPTLVSTVWGRWKEVSVFHISKNWGNSSSSVGARLKRWAKSTPKWRSSWSWLWIRKEPSGARPVARWSRKLRPENSHSRWASKELTPADLLSPPATQYHRRSLTSRYTEQYYSAPKKLHLSSAVIPASQSRTLQMFKEIAFADQQIGHITKSKWETCKVLRSMSLDVK